MIKYLRLPFQFDAGLLQRDLDRLTGRAWPLHYQKLHYEGDWSALALRSINGDTDNIYISPEKDPVYADTHLLEACSYFKEVLSQFNCPLLAVRLLRLGPGAVIKEHRDHELCFENNEMRIHIPVITHEQVEFYLDKERIFLQEGECWYMNFNLPHAVSNRSPVARVHLVIDALVNDWAKKLFTRPALLKKEMAEPVYDANTLRQMIALFREMNTETGNRMADELEASQKRDVGEGGG